MLGRTADRLISRLGWRAGLRLLAQMRMAKLAPRSRIVHLRVPGLKAPLAVRARTSDVLVVKELLFTGNFEFQLPASPKFIVDAGANIGAVSALLASRYPDARIVALELHPENFALLSMNARHYPNVEPVLAGLWPRTTSLSLANPEAQAFAFRARDAVDGGAAIPGLTVLDILARSGESTIDLLKIDIEGGEKEVFGPEAEQWLDKVSTIAIELHERFVPGCETAVVDRLAGRFSREHVGELDVFHRLAARAPSTSGD